MEPVDFGTEQFTDEDRAYKGSRFSEVRDALQQAAETLSVRAPARIDNAVISYNGDFVIHFNHPTWRDDRNDPSTATRISGRKVR